MGNDKVNVLTPDEVRRLIVEHNLDVERVLANVNRILARWDGHQPIGFRGHEVGQPQGERGGDVMRQVISRLRDAGWTVDTVADHVQVTA